MPSMPGTVNISMGFKTWTDMAKTMQDYAGSEEASSAWGATNPNKTAVYIMMDVPNPEVM